MRGPSGRGGAVCRGLGAWEGSVTGARRQREGGYHCTSWSKTYSGCGWDRASQSGTASVIPGGGAGCWGDPGRLCGLADVVEGPVGSGRFCCSQGKTNRIRLSANLAIADARVASAGDRSGSAGVTRRAWKRSVARGLWSRRTGSDGGQVRGGSHSGVWLRASGLTGAFGEASLLGAASAQFFAIPTWPEVLEIGVVGRFARAVDRFAEPSLRRTAGDVGLPIASPQAGARLDAPDGSFGVVVPGGVEVLHHVAHVL